MRIKSRFKDYYDYVEYLYSQVGGDTSNTYMRGTVPPTSNHDEWDKELEVAGNIPAFPSPIYTFRSSPGDFPWKYKWCSVCGKLYLLVTDLVGGQEPDYKVISEGHPSLDKVTTLFGWKRERPKMSDLVGVSSECCVEISKRLGSPVFTLEYSHPIRHTRVGNKAVSRVTIGTNVPNLGKLGFASILTAEQMYQDIAMFLGSLNNDPDGQPPVNVSDKDRLLQKGFDAKISFRGTHGGKK